MSGALPPSGEDWEPPQTAAGAPAAERDRLGHLIALAGRGALRDEDVIWADVFGQAFAARMAVDGATYRALPRHPTYGDVFEVLREVQDTLGDGRYVPRIAQMVWLRRLWEDTAPVLAEHAPRGLR